MRSERHPQPLGAWRSGVLRRHYATAVKNALHRADTQELLERTEIGRRFTGLGPRLTIAVLAEL
jgi:hypothetical protein